MRLVVPVSGSDPKTRLSTVLSPDERREFTTAMLEDVLTALDAAGHRPEVVSTAPVPCDAPLTVDDRELDPLVNDLLVETHGASIRDYRRLAREAGATVAEVDSRRLATDIDEPADLAEVLLHSDGAAADWLRDAGFELAVDDGRVSVRR